MNAQTRNKLDRTRQYMLTSALPEDTKDGLGTLLDAAETAANGIEDKERVRAMTEAILALAMHETRQAVRAPANLKTAIDAHTAACPLAGTSNRGVWLALAMKPWPWIAASVIAFSPHAPRIIETIARVAQ